MQDINSNKFVEAELYNHNYYLTDCDGYEDYANGNFNLRRHKRAINLAKIKGGEKVLDVGCGRGELAYQCALLGCKVLAVDYSDDALSLTGKTLKRLPGELQENASIKLTEVTEMNIDDKFDVVFMIDLVEHLYDWQLAALFKKVRELLSVNGRLVIQTPNLDYERFLFPLKRIISLPVTVIKHALRVLRGKRREETWKQWFKKTFRILPGKERGNGLIRIMHVNTHTRGHLKNLLSDFETQIFCYDHSRNIVSLIFNKWWGREIMIIAK